MGFIKEQPFNDLPTFKKQLGTWMFTKTADAHHLLNLRQT
jgi:hypothetical protein